MEISTIRSVATFTPVDSKSKNANGFSNVKFMNDGFMKVEITTID